MKVNEFLQEVESIYKSEFSHSLISVKYSSNLYASIWIIPLLAGDKSEVYNGIWENDILRVRFEIDTQAGEFNHALKLDNDLPENLRLSEHGKSYWIKPDNQYMAYGTRRLSFRETKGDALKILASWSKFVKQLKQSLTDDLSAGMITDNYKDLVEKKLNSF